MMLFNFQLRQINEISPFGYENQLSLHWYGLTDGWFWLHVGDDELFRFNDALINQWKVAGESWDNPYAEYFVVCLWEDLMDILPSILEPIPEDILQQCDPGQKGWQYLNREEAWLERYDDWSTWRMGTGWLRSRQLYATYLVLYPGIRFWTDGETLFITWDNHDCLDNGIPIWSTQQGQYALPLARFIDEVRSFDARLIAAMDQRVKSAQMDWPFPNVAIDIDFLEVDHRERATKMDQAFTRSRQQKTDWDGVRKAMDIIG